MVHTTGTHTSHSVPVPIIRVHIVVDQILFKVVCSISPVLLQVESQVRSDDLTTTIAHEACRIELSHEGIDDWHACASSFPPMNQFCVFSPVREAIIADWTNALELKHLCLMSLTVEAEEVTPAQFKVEMRCRFVCNNLPFILLELFVDLAYRKTAVCKPWRELGGVIWTNHSIPCLFVLC